jgi:hypothetical protein
VAGSHGRLRVEAEVPAKAIVLRTLQAIELLSPRGFARYARAQFDHAGRMSKYPSGGRSVGDLLRRGRLRRRRLFDRHRNDRQPKVLTGREPTRMSYWPLTFS